MDRTNQTVTADEIVSAAIAGDEPAFAALAERHRRELRRSMSRQTFVAMRYSQARNCEPPWNPDRPRHAFRKVSCTASSASSNEASIR